MSKKLNSDLNIIKGTCCWDLLILDSTDVLKLFNSKPLLTCYKGHNSSSVMTNAMIDFVHITHTYKDQNHNFNEELIKLPYSKLE